MALLVGVVKASNFFVLIVRPLNFRCQTFEFNFTVIKILAAW